MSRPSKCQVVSRRAPSRMGENDAWLVATAESIPADIVGADRKAFERLGAGYLRDRVNAARDRLRAAVAVQYCRGLP